MQPWQTILGLTGDVLRFAAGAMALAAAILQWRPRPTRDPAKH